MAPRARKHTDLAVILGLCALVVLGLAAAANGACNEGVTAAVGGVAFLSGRLAK